MAETKASFVLYKSYKAMTGELTDEQAGKLFKAILAYANGEDTPDLDPSTRLAFIFIRTQMDADAVKYEKRVEANRRNGARGGRPPKPTESEAKPNIPLGFEEQQKAEAEKKPSGRKEYSPEFEELWKLYPIKDDKWNGYLKYQARRKKYSHEQLMTAVKGYLERKKRDREYPKYVKQLQTLLSNDMADFTQYLKSAEEKLTEASEDDWAGYFAGRR